MIGTLAIALIFATAFLVTVLWGWHWTFIAVYIPSLLLLNQIPQIEIPHAPLVPYFAPLYAIILAMPLRGESIRFKICSVDIIFLLLVVSSVITAWSTEVFETGINTLRTEFFTLTAPYLLARIVFQRWEMRRACLYILIGITAVLSFSALIEFRLQPYFYLHVLQALGMGNKIQPMAYTRYGFYRVAGSVEHPIYFGNMCVVLLGMMAVLARTSGVSLKNGWVATALVSVAGCVVTSISFTPYVGMIAGTCALMTLLFVPFSRKLVFPGTVLIIAALFTFTYHTATAKLPDRPDSEFEQSLWVRKLIITETWKKAETAGPFGYGIRPEFDDDEDFDLKSMDNSYMQFTVARGWVYTTLWTSIAFFFSYRCWRGFRAVRHRSQLFPLAVCTATVLGLMVSMYTVWAGALYTVVWGIMVGLSNTLIDQVIASSRETVAAIPTSRPNRGFDPVTVGRPGPAVAY